MTARSTAGMIVDDDGATGGESTPMEEAERTPPLPSQKAQILDIMAEKAFMEAGDVWYPISFRWWDAWRQYVGLEQEEDVKGSFSADENLFPGAIDNSGLQGDSDREIDKKKLCDQDYALLPEKAYKLLKEWYGGPGPDFPRRVVEVGQQREAKVEVFPYFLSYSTAESPSLAGTPRATAGEAPLMLDSTTPVESAVKQLCEAAGVEERYAQLYLVSEGGAMGHVEAKLAPPNGGGAAPAAAAGSERKLEPVDPKSYEQRTLADVFFGQHRVQLFIEDRKWRFELKPGDELDARDTDKAWYDSRVVEVVEPADPGEIKKIKVHFKCWDSRWDDTVEVTSDRLAPLFSRSENWRAGMKEGTELEIKGQGNKWYRGSVQEVDDKDPNNRRVLVTCSELSTSPLWKEWESEDICRLHVHIQRPQATTTGGAVKRSGSSSALASTRTSPSAAAAGGGGGYTLGGSSSYSSMSTALTTTNKQSSSSSSYSPYSSSMNGYGYGRMSTRGAPPEAGAVGLSNLGNTCFMNSMLQCLSNTEVLTTYFLGGRYEPEINERNPLGMKGQLARVYAKLMKDMWSGDFTTVSPTEFKRVIGNFAPQFAGYQQHDSQELMNFVLDGLHEDLNRVRNKPYVPDKDYDNNEPDEQVAVESWQRYLQRNDSMVVDYCQGQLKSHVTCPKCGYNSVTFDPYMNLQLPLPVTNTVRITFTFFPLPWRSTPIRAMAQIPAQGTGRDLKAWILEHIQTGDVASSGGGATAAPPEEQEEGDEDGGPDRMLVDGDGAAARGAVSPTPRRLSPRTAIDMTDNYDKRVFAQLLDTEPISKMAKPQIEVHAYQLEHNPADDPMAVVFTVLFGKVRSTFGFGNKAYERFGVPLRMTAKPDMTNHQIYIRAANAVERLVRHDPGGMQQGDRIFKLIYANQTGTTNDGDVPDDNAPFCIDPRRQTVVVLFSQEVFSEYVDKDLTERYQAHSSISRKDGGQARKTINLQDCLDKFTEREQLGADDLWYCTKCKERLQAFKKMDVWSTPDVLILHLKRFSYVQSYFVTREKIEDLVSFPIEGLDLRPVLKGPVLDGSPPIYDLYAVSEHSGGLGGGHYTAVARNFKNGKWYSFNDSYVTEIADDNLEAQVVTPRAYVLFYKRRTGSLKWAGASSGSLASEGGLKAEMS